MAAIAKILVIPACALLAACASMQAGSTWKAELKCNARDELPAFAAPLIVRVDRNEFFLDNGGAASQPGYVRLRGFPDPDDRLELSGEIAPPGGKPTKASLQGRRDGTGYALAGRAGRQNCSVAMRLE